MKASDDGNLRSWISEAQILGQLYILVDPFGRVIHSLLQRALIVWPGRGTPTKPKLWTDVVAPTLA